MERVFAVRVLSQRHLVALILFPRNVSGMMVADQYHPMCPRLFVPFCLPCPAIDDLGSRFGLAERVRTRINRITEDREYAVVNRQLPNDLLSELVERYGRK